MKGRKSLRRAGIVLGFGALLCAGMLASGALGMTSGITGSTDSSSTATDTTASTSTSADTTGSTTTDTTPPPTTTDTTSSTTTTTASIFTPSLSSDQADYAPGATVTLTGSGWPAGDAVRITVDDSVGQSWSYGADVTADLAGNFTNQFQLPNWFVANYSAAATDATGLRATATFTDSTQATAVVNPKVGYRNTAGNVYTFSVTNTGTTTLNFVRVTMPNGGAYTITACSGSGWSATVSGNNCDLTGGTIGLGATGTFQATASISDGTNDLNRTWGLRVSDTGSNSGGNPATESPSGSLAASAYVFEIEDAVIATSNPTIGANCPSANKSAIAGSTRVIIICGRNHAVLALTPLAGNSALGGTMIGAAGTFNSGSVAGNSSQSKVLAYYSGATITSSVGTGKTVTALIGNAASTSPPPSVTLTGYEATPTAFTITASAGANGSITPSGAVSVSNGGSQAFTIAPAANYHVADVLVDGSSVGAVTSYNFTNVTAAHTIAASFAINNFTVTPSAGAHGALSPSTAQTVNYNDTKAFTVNPDTGYHIASVSGCSGSLVGSTFTTGAITADCTVSATFAINTYTVTPSAGAHGSLTPSTPQTVNYNDTKAFTVNPDTGYHISSVSGCGGSLLGSTYTTGAVTADCTVSASFAINVYSLSYSAGANGSLTGDTSQSVNHGANGSAVTAVPNTGYHFVKWSDDSTANPRTDTNVTGPISVTASFAINQYTLSYTVGANGTISGTSPQTVNHGSSGSAVTAVPNTGYHFVKWSDDSTDNPRTDTNVTGPISVTATFAINTYLVTPSAGAHGSLSPATAQTVNYNETTAFTVNPDSGYHILSVAGCGGSLAGNTYTTGPITAACTVTASFEIDNFAPVITAPADQNADEGTLKAFNLGSFVDAVGSPWAVTVNWGDLSPNSTFSASSDGVLATQSHTYADGPNQYTVTVTVKDSLNLSDSKLFKVTVANLAPTVTSFSGPNVLYGPLVFGLSGSFNGSFTDPGRIDNPWIASFTWGGVADPATQSIGPNDTDTHSFTVRPQFTSAGCNTVAVAKVTDKNGDFGTKSATVQVGTGEFLAPVSNTPVTDKLKNGQVLPVKVRISNCNGNPITGLAPTIVLKKGDLTDGVLDDSLVTVTPDSVSAADSTGVMRAVDGYYIYNMKVSLPNADLGTTPYTIIITPGITGYVANMQLRHKIMATK
jgi:hypothetical protein